MSTKISHFGDRFWLFSSLIGFSILYLNLVWKTTGSIDRLTMDGLFWVAIICLVGRRKDRLNYQSDTISVFLGFCLIGIILFKLVSLFWFESILISLTPVCFAISLALLASGIRGLRQYWQELFFAGFLFFPGDAMGLFIDKLFNISILTAKFSAYSLYYVGFDVSTQGNRLFLYVPNIGEFQAVVRYGCTGIPMMLLMLKLALLLIAFFSLPKIQQILIPMTSVAIGFFLGVIRVCILTLTIPESANFDYWHGYEGSQIFSTLAICIFSGFCYWIFQQREVKLLSFESSASKNIVRQSHARQNKVSDCHSRS